MDFTYFGFDKIGEIFLSLIKFHLFVELQNTREEFVNRLDSSAANDPIRAVWSAFKMESLVRFAERGAGDELSFVLPDLPAWSMATVFCR